MPLRHFQRILFAASCSLAIAAQAAEPLEAGSAPVISLRELPLLFADDSGVTASSGVIRSIHPAQTRKAPVIEAERPWESDRVYIYGSVYRDDAAGLFRMWY